MVGFNENGEETRVNIEMLFNAAIQNKELFKRMFIKGEDMEPKRSFADEMAQRIKSDAGLDERQQNHDNEPRE